VHTATNLLSISSCCAMGGSHLSCMNSLATHHQGLGTAQLLQRLAHTGHLLAKFIMMKLRTVATVKSIVQFDSFDVVDALSEMLPVRCERFAF